MGTKHKRRDTGLEILLTTREAAEMMNVQPWTLRAWVRAGKGPRVHRLPTGRMRFTKADLLAWMHTEGGEQE